MSGKARIIVEAHRGWDNAAAADGFKAYLADCPGLWEFGRSQAEAVGKLVNTLGLAKIEWADRDRPQDAPAGD